MVRARAQPPGEARLEGGVAIGMAGDLLAVQAHDGIGHCALEMENGLAPVPRRIGGERLLVGKGALIGALVEIGERQVHRVMRQANTVTGFEKPVVVEVDAGHGMPI